MLDAIIIDDEKPGRDSLKTILNLHFPVVSVIGEADSVKTGIKLLSQTTPDVLFLDINLSDGSGFNILEKLEQIDFQIIFVTAYNNFAIQAFQVNALDYILKPIQIAAISEALKRVKKELTTLSREDIKILKQNIKADLNDQRIIIREVNGSRYIKIKDIIRCQAHINYTQIHLYDGSRIMTSKTLKEFANILEQYGFFRSHQSHLVNINAIQKITKEDGLFLELEKGEKVALSRRRKHLLVELLNGISL